MAADTRALRNLAVLAAAWEIAGRFRLVAGGALPSLSAIAERVALDWRDLIPHALATCQSAAAGFLIGDAAAIAAGFLFAASPLALRLTRGLNVALFALPPIAVAPVLALTLDPFAARVTLAALGCYFATMTATVIGLTQADARSLDVVRAYGGGRWSRLRWVQARGAAPAILGGLRVAAPNAVLGAILAEFGGGGRWGLGAYLLGSLGRADPARLWAIGLTATAIAAAAYGAFAWIGNRLLGASRAVTIAPGAPPAAAAESRAAKLLVGLGAAALPLLIWQGVVMASGAPALIAKTPLDVIAYLTTSARAEAAQGKLAAALAQTLPLAGVGLVAGLATAFALGVLAHVRPGFTRALLPVAMVTQTMPLVALTPLLVLLLGRGVALTVAVTVSVTFFPAYVAIVQGLGLTSRAALELPRAYGATAWREMRLVTIPSALPYVFAAARLAAPRALLGVMIAEWLATGGGLGNLLNQSRGYLDYGMIWSVAAVSVLVSMAIFYAVVIVERIVLGRLGMTTAE